MGNSQLTDQQILLFKNETQFTPTQIRRIHKKFLQLDTNNKGFISCQDLLKILNQHKLGPLVAEYLMGKKNQEIDFIQLVKLLNAIQFGDKNQLLAKLLDSDKDGYLSVEDIQRAITTLNPHCFQQSYELSLQLMGDQPQLTYNQFIKILIDY